MTFGVVLYFLSFLSVSLTLAARQNLEAFIPPHAGLILFKHTQMHPPNSTSVNLCCKEIIFIEKTYLEDEPKVREINFDNNYTFDFYNGYPFVRSKTIEKISMKNCAISKIAPNTFRGTPNLKDLQLSYNLLKEMTGSPFVSTPLIENLDLSFNEMVKFDGVDILKPLTKLKTLSLSGAEKIPNIETGVIVSDSLEVLNCAQCGFTKLTNETTSRIPNIRRLFLQANSISRIDKNIFSSKLKYLNVFVNPLIYFDVPIKDIIHMETLCVSPSDLVLHEEYEKYIWRIAQLEENCQTNALTKMLEQLQTTTEARKYTTTTASVNSTPHEEETTITPMTVKNDVGVESEFYIFNISTFDPPAAARNTTTNTKSEQNQTNGCLELKVIVSAWLLCNILLHVVRLCFEIKLI